MRLFDLIIANMELFVFSEVSKTCGTGIKFPYEPGSLVCSDLNKLLPTAEYSFHSYLFEQPNLRTFQNGILPGLIYGKILRQSFSVPEK